MSLGLPLSAIIHSLSFEVGEKHLTERKVEDAREKIVRNVYLYLPTHTAVALSSGLCAQIAAPLIPPFFSFSVKPCNNFFFIKLLNKRGVKNKSILFRAGSFYLE